jgi:hypothetical protein
MFPSPQNERLELKGDLFGDDEKFSAHKTDALFFCSSRLRGDFKAFTSVAFATT